MLSLGVILGLFASFAGFLFGYDTGYISGCKEMPAFLQVYGDLQSDGTYKLSTQTDSIITSILSAGTFFGALFAATIGDAVGRRRGILIYLVLFAIGVALQTAGKSLGAFAAGRVLAGLGVGGTSTLVPVYQAECAPRKLRGFCVSCYQFFITVGLLIAAVVVNATKGRPDASAYQIPIAVQFIWGTIIAVGMFVLPESPRWLLMRDRHEEAKASLSKVIGQSTDSRAVLDEYDEIYATLQKERALGGGSWIDCFSNGENKARQRILTGMILQACTQLSGINFIFYYGTSFFSNSGIANPFLITVITNVVNVVMTVPGMLSADFIGRRPMVMYGAAGMAVCQFIVAAVGVATPITDKTSQSVLVAFVCIFIAHFAATFGPFSWIVTSEIPPYNLRTKSMALSTASNWLLNFAIGYATPYMVNTGPGNAGLQTNVFWIWGGFCLLAFVFAYFMIPETKQLSLEQIDLLYLDSTPRTSAKFRRHLIQDNVHLGTTPIAVGEKADVAHLDNSSSV